MRILYCITHMFNSGGMERVLTQKVNWLAAHTKHELTIITTERTPEGMNECYFALDKRVQVKHCLLRLWQKCLTFRLRLLMLLH